ncbi:MAG: hypothetical protein ACRDF6_11475 [bacterium]
MRTSWKLIGTASLLCTGALTLQQCRSTPAEEGQPAFKPVATIDQVMDAVIIPNAQTIWDAVVYNNGVLVQSPKTDDDWYNLQMNAYAVAEAGNLLMIPPRAKDEGDWMKFSAALTQRSVEAVRAAERKDLQGLLTAGGNMYNVCTDCHRKYVTPDPNAPDPPVPTAPGTN